MQRTPLHNNGKDTKQKLNQKVEEKDYNMKMMKKYIKALEAFKTANYYIGEGLENKLDILDKLTDKICNGSKSKKIYNQIVMLLDILLKNGTMTNEKVKQYYKQFLF